MVQARFAGQRTEFRVAKALRMGRAGVGFSVKSSPHYYLLPSRYQLRPRLDPSGDWESVNLKISTSQGPLGS